MSWWAGIFVMACLPHASAGGADHVADTTVIDVAASADQVRHLSTLLRGGRRGMAEQTSREWLSEGLDSSDHWAMLALTLRGERAERVFQESLRLDPTSPYAQVGLAAMLRQAGQLDGAQRMLEVAVRSAAATGEAWLALASVQHARGDQRAALETARSTVRQFPELTGAHLLVAELDPEGAAAALSEGVASAEIPSELHTALADLLLRDGDAEGAAAQLDAALDADPRHVEGLRLRPLADCLRDGTLDAPGYTALDEARRSAFLFRPDALFRADDLVLRYPRCAMPWVSRAAVRQAAGQLPAALSDLSRAAVLRSDEPLVAEPYGLALARAGRAREGLRWLADAREKRPWDVDLVVTETRANLALGDRTTARRLAEQAHALLPHDVPLTLLLSELVDDRQTAFELLLAAVHDSPFEGELERRATELGEELGRAGEVQAILDVRRALVEAQERHLRPAVRNVAFGDEVVVYGTSEATRLREVLGEKLQSMGYGPGKERSGHTRYAARSGRPGLTVHHDGQLEIDKTVAQVAPPQADPVNGRDGMAFGMLNQRQASPLRWEVLETVGPELIAWREALAAAGTAGRLSQIIPDQLDALWADGRPLSGGDTLTTPEARRAALLHHWATRTCTASGAQVRTYVGRFLDLVVDDSPWPTTEAERAAARAATTCEGAQLGPPAVESPPAVE